MTNVAEQFEKNKYVYISDVLSKEECSKLTEYMFTLSKEGKLEKDPQCPLSGAIYGDQVFDSILERLKKPLSDQLGIDLLPTYTYARLYERGEVLKRHSDRPSCEISATMTLGFDPDETVWPIFFAKNKSDSVGTPLNIDVGDLVMYKGEELPHWRPKFEGKWQVQVFFHYVDANGPHKDYKYDGRKALGISKEIDKIESPDKKVIKFNYFGHGRLIGLIDGMSPGPITYSSSFHPDLPFTLEECEKIKDIGRKGHARKASIGDESNSRVDTEVRSVDEYEISIFDPENAWIFDKLGYAIAIANTEYFKFNLLGIIHGIQLLHYKGEDKGHYHWHVDIGNETAATRKISVSVPLSDPSEYEGGSLEFNNGGILVGANEKGSITMFPSYMLHRVTPLTSGERWVMVIWIHGSDRFK